MQNNDNKIILESRLDDLCSKYNNAVRGGEELLNSSVPTYKGTTSKLKSFFYNNKGTNSLLQINSTLLKLDDTTKQLKYLNSIKLQMIKFGITERLAEDALEYIFKNKG